MPNLWRLVRRKRNVSLVIMPLLLCEVCYADRDVALNYAEAAAAAYSDLIRSTQVLSGSYTHANRFFEAAGTASQVNLGYSGRNTKFKNPDAVLTEQLRGDDSVMQHGLSFDLNQGLAVGTDVGLTLGHVDSKLGTSSWFGGRFGQWWREETFQTTLSVRHTLSNQQETEIYVADTRQAHLPEELSGTNLSLNLKHLTTPTTILQGTYSFTKRSDRPTAWGASGEVRQFLTLTNSAVHLSYAHYENVGKIEPITADGGIVANTYKGEWHQRLYRIVPLFPRSILMVGYRYYDEVENFLGPVKANGTFKSDWMYGALRLFFDRKKDWVDDTSEINFFFGQYTTTGENKGTLFGLGSRLVL